MATRKHRSRRAKTFRHEHALIDYDEDGNEIETSASELRAKKGKPERAKPAAQAKGARAERCASRRCRRGGARFRRGALWGGTIAASCVLLQEHASGRHPSIGVFYAAMFIPLTYRIDGIVYRKYLTPPATRRSPGKRLPAGSEPRLPDEA